MDKWISDTILKMHQHKIKQKTIAERTGYSEQWISEIFNGKRKSDKAQKSIETAVAELANVTIKPDTTTTQKGD